MREIYWKTHVLLRNWKSNGFYVKIFACGERPEAVWRGGSSRLPQPRSSGNAVSWTKFIRATMTHESIFDAMSNKQIALQFLHCARSPFFSCMQRATHRNARSPSASAALSHAVHSGSGAIGGCCCVVVAVVVGCVITRWRIGALAMAIRLAALGAVTRPERRGGCWRLCCQCYWCRRRDFPFAVASRLLVRPDHWSQVLAGFLIACERLVEFCGDFRVGSRHLHAHLAHATVDLLVRGKVSEVRVHLWVALTNFGDGGGVLFLYTLK